MTFWCIATVTMTVAVTALATGDRALLAVSAMAGVTIGAVCVLSEVITEDPISRMIDAHEAAEDMRQGKAVEARIVSGLGRMQQALQYLHTNRLI